MSETTHVSIVIPISLCFTEIFCIRNIKLALFRDPGRFQQRFEACTVAGFHLIGLVDYSREHEYAL